MSAKNRKPKPVPEVTLHLAPLARCTLAPAGRDGVLTIGDDVYRIGYHDDGRDISGYRVTKDDGATYDIPYDLSVCECRGFLRHGKCKHLAAIRCVRAAGKGVA